MGIIKVCDPNWDASNLPTSLDNTVPDHIILASALRVQSEWEKRKTIVVSRDINMRVIANSLGLESEDYITAQAVDDADKLYDGFEEVLVDDQIIDQFYAGEEIILDEEQALSIIQTLCFVRPQTPKSLFVALSTTAPGLSKNGLILAGISLAQRTSLCF